MRKIPKIHIGKRIAVICEGYEEYDYIMRLKKCKVWSNEYYIIPYNAKSIDNIFAVYQNVFQSTENDAILIYCDTELYPYEKFNNMQRKINAFRDKQISQEITIFANPCTMQIILSHFARVSLKSNSKTENSALIYQHTGVKNYHAEEQQRNAIMRKINANNYKTMKTNIKGIDGGYCQVPSTNVAQYFANLESNDTKWVDKIRELID